LPNRAPAAFPLIAFIAGLALAPVLVNPRLAVIGLIAIALLHRRSFALFVAAGLLLAPKPVPFPPVDPEEFAVIEAPIDHDWAERDGSFVLRARQFRANGHEVDMPIAIYTRFAPPAIGMHASLRAEAFLRINDRGQYVVSVKAAQLLAYDGQLSPFDPAAWNRALANALERHAKRHPDEVALAQALVLGRGERLTEEMKTSFRGGGTYHLLVFSGLQIALAAALLGALLRWLHAPRASDWLLLTFAVIAPLFIGPTASVSRASLGIGLYALSRIAKRPTSVENLWCVAALLRLVLEPRDLFEASFHLTYAGAGALLFLGKRWFTRPLTIEISIAPLTLFHFNQYALGGSLLTLAMSLVIFAMLVASAVACAVPHDAVFGLIALLHRVCTFVNGFGLAGPFAAPPTAALVIGAFAALIALATVRGPRRAGVIALAMLIPTVAAIVKSKMERRIDNPRVTFLDVGQGDAILIRSGTRTILVDGGMDGRIVPLLADRGIRRIDMAVLTHAHPDHCGGLVAVIQQFEVGKLLVSPHRFRGDCATRLLAGETPVHLIRDGDRLAVGDLHLQAYVAGNFRRSPENNASVVLRVDAGGRRVLLTGDVEAEAEIALALGDVDLRADVLKVAHHGSRSSTTPRFLDAVQPRLAMISCGRRNLFGHPHPSVLDELHDRRIRIWRTDRSGSIDLDIREGRLYVTARTD
jgi:competence protein ComEC